MIPPNPQLEITFDGGEAEETVTLVVHTWGIQGATCDIRCLPDIDRYEVRELARARAFKGAFFEQPYGGAEAGIRTPRAANAEARMRLARQFGRHLACLLQTRAIHAWYSVNFGPAELSELYAAIGIPTAFSAKNSAVRTARSTFSCVIAAANALKLRPSECRIAVEGFGAVAVELLRRLNAWGARVVAVSNSSQALVNPAGIPVDTLLEQHARLGRNALTQAGQGEQLPSGDLYCQPADLLVCCGRGLSINEEVAVGIQAKAVVPSANVPCTGDAEQVLLQRGIRLLPDFVVSVGGTLGFLGEQEDTFYKQDFRQMIERLLLRAEQAGTSPVALARETANTRFDPNAECTFLDVGWKKKAVDALRARFVSRKRATDARRAALIKLVNETYAN